MGSLIPVQYILKLMVTAVLYKITAVTLDDMNAQNDMGIFSILGAGNL